MKKNKRNNWKEVVDVVVFTMKQQIKTRSFQIAFIVLVSIAFFGPFVAGILQQEKESEKPKNTTIETLYIVEDLEHELEIGYNELFELPYYKNVKTIQIEPNDEKKIEKIKKHLEKKESNHVLLEIYEEEQFSIKICKPRNNTLWEGEGKNLLEEVEGLLEKAIKKYTNISKEQQNIVDMTIDTKVQVLCEDGSRKDLGEENGIAYDEQTYIYGFIFILLMIGVYAGSAIASSVVSEKNGKVLEYLLTAVSPLHLLLGKIVGMLLLVIGEILCIGCIAKISDYMAAAMQGNEKSILSGFIPTTVLERITFSNVILALILVCLNLIFFGFLAAFSGTKASRIEELKDTLMVFSVGELIGGYLAMFSSIYMMEETTGGFLYFSYIFPLSSSFLLPGAIFTGKMDWKIVTIAILLLVICILILIHFTVKSYQEHLFLSGVKRKKKRGVPSE